MTTSKKVRKVKGWVNLMSRGRAGSFWKRLPRGVAKKYLEHLDVRDFVPATLTYSLPKKKR